MPYLSVFLKAAKEEDTEWACVASSTIRLVAQQPETRDITWVGWNLMLSLRKFLDGPKGVQAFGQQLGQPEVLRIFEAARFRQGWQVELRRASAGGPRVVQRRRVASWRAPRNSRREDARSRSAGGHAREGVEIEQGKGP